MNNATSIHVFGKQHCLHFNNTKCQNIESNVWLDKNIKLFTLFYAPLIDVIIVSIEVGELVFFKKKNFRNRLM